MFHDIGKIFSQKSAFAKYKPQIEAVRVLALAKDTLVEIWGKEILDEVMPISYAQGILKFVTLSSASASELLRFEERIVSSLNNKIGKESIKRIRIEHN